MNSYELYTEQTCCGCGACVVKCPKNAITLEENKYGFVYPQIDSNLCIDCGSCKRICTFSKEKKANEFECYACANKDNDLLMKSASGGAFSAIAYEFIKAGGYVCGASAVIKEGIITVEHCIINDVKNLYKLQGSKYVQSSTLSAFGTIQELLRSGEKVLFSGTPCQVDAMKSLCKEYIGKRLFTIDIICHGVPSQKFFNGYLQEYQKRQNSILTYIDFRNKKYGWGLTGIAKFKNREDDTVTIEKTSYYKLFLEGEIYRDNCYSCPYANLNRVGEITIGDYWGIQSLSPELLDEIEMSEKKGVSCLLVNNEIGKSMVEDFGTKLVIKPVEIEKVMVINTQLKEPAKHTSKREKILETFVINGYEPIEERFEKERKIDNLKKTVKNMIPKPIKHIVKKIINS